MDRAVDWDDLHLVLAVAEEGTLSGAARRLGVTHSTIFRRLGGIERDLGVRLFDRFRDGYSATPAGESVAALGARFADEFLALERRLSGQDLRASGTVRITTTDTVCTMLIRHLPALRAAHPELRLEIAISNAMANLTRREADVAIRPFPSRQRLLSAGGSPTSRTPSTLRRTTYLAAPTGLNANGSDLMTRWRPQ